MRTHFHSRVLLSLAAVACVSAWAADPAPAQKGQSTPGYIQLPNTTPRLDAPRGTISTNMSANVPTPATTAPATALPAAPAGIPTIPAAGGGTPAAPASAPVPLVPSAHPALGQPVKAYATMHDAARDGIDPFAGQAVKVTGPVAADPPSAWAQVMPLLRQYGPFFGMVLVAGLAAALYRRRKG